MSLVQAKALQGLLYTRGAHSNSKLFIGPYPSFLQRRMILAVQFSHGWEGWGRGFDSVGDNT